MLYIDAQNLTIAYGKNTILENINFKVFKGEKIGIIGKNGSGKTTLVESLMGVNNAEISGQLMFYENIQKYIRAVFQEYEFDRGMSLKHIYLMYSLLTGLEPYKDVKALFKAYDLEDKLNDRFHKLSGGQKQKFKLLMCLELKPKLIILDEVTTSLDIEWRSEIFKIINAYFDLNPDCALILISHDYRELKRLTNKNYLISNKKIEEIKDLESYFLEHDWQ